MSEQKIAPSTSELTIEQQAEIWATLLEKEKSPSVALMSGAVASGIINPWRIAAWKAARAFKTNDADTIKVKEQTIKLAPREEPVLILGDSGVGKELLANILHGERRGQLVGVNVCAVSPLLFESELFGHTRGAFTGAERERNGLIKQAEGGTLFLDEVGDMPADLQVKLLRTINNRTFRKVGGNTDEQLLCRIVAATHKDLKAMSKLDPPTFRLDLYQRLSVFELKVKPLREKMDDCKLLVNSVAYTRILELVKTVPPEKVLPGNVRQLLNLALRIEVLGVEAITVEDIQ